MDFLEALRQTAANFVPFISGALPMVVGLFMVYSGVRTLSLADDPRINHGEGGPWKKAGLKVLVGALLLRFSSTMQEVSETLFGSRIQDPRGVLAYMNLPQSGGAWRMVLEVCLLWLVLIGWAAAFRGFLRWYASANGTAAGGEDPFWSGLWHIIGGAACINGTGAIQAFLGR